jgi:hypothetical protein
MFKNIVDKIERATINYTVKHVKPNSVDYYNANGDHYRIKDYLFKSQSRFSYNDKGQEILSLYARNGKIIESTTYEYNENGERCKSHTRRFDYINNERILEKDDLWVANDDGTYTSIINGITKVCPRQKSDTVKDDHGNVIEETITTPSENCVYHAVNTYDGNNNQVLHEATEMVGDKVKEFFREINQYDDKNRRVKRIFYMNTEYGTEKSTDITYYYYDDKDRVIRMHNESNYNKPGPLHTGNFKHDTWYRYNEEENSELSYSDHGSWQYNSYQKTTILSDGRKMVAHWTLPNWIEKLRRFFNAF